MSHRPPDGDVPPVPEWIDCIDCGGVAHRISFPPEERDWEPGEVVAYRCADCLDRWDLVVPGAEDDEDDDGW